ncbi:MAG: DNA translocase FtsK [Clostridia bacterium]|nr:DNA translocase FtsK [Clostridia bacterium]
MSERNESRKTGGMIPRETVGFMVVVVSIFLFLCCVTRSVLFSNVGKAVCDFMYGSFGYGCIFLIALLCYAGVLLISDRAKRPSGKWAVAVFFAALCLFLLFQTVSAELIGLDIDGASYGGYLGDTYRLASDGISGYTCGGVISALIVYPVAALTTYIGAYVIFAVASLVLIGVSFIAVRNMLFKNKVSKFSNVKSYDDDEEESYSKRAEKPISAVLSEPVSYSNPRTIKVAVNTKKPLYVPPTEHEEDAIPAESADAALRADLAEPATGNGPSSESAAVPKAHEPDSREILFGEHGSAGDSFHSNLIYSDSSYFNHPVNNQNDYYSGFGDNDGFVATGNIPSKREESHIDTSAHEEYPVDFVFGEEPSADIFGDMTSSQPIDLDVSPSEESANVPAAAPISFEEDEDMADEETFGYYGDTADEPKEVFETQEDFDEEDGEIPESGMFRGRAEGAEPSGFSEGEFFDMTSDSDVPDDDGDALRPDLSFLNLFGPDNENLSSGDFDRRSRANLFDYSDNDEGDDENSAEDEISRGRMRGFSDETPEEERVVRAEPERPKFEITPPTRGNATREPKPAEEPKPKTLHKWRQYKKPPISLLSDYEESSGNISSEIEHHKIDIVEVLRSYNIESHIERVITGCKVVRYDVMLEDARQNTKALSYIPDIQMALHAETINGYRNYKQSCLSLEVPNPKGGIIGLKALLETPAFLDSKPGSLVFGLGKSIDGRPICPDITEMPHLLIAGTTGSGKSICLNALIVSLIYKYGPEDLRFILVDPKQVEFIVYSKLPHLMINDILSDVNKVIKALKWAIAEMERRYGLFKEKTEKGKVTRDIGDYNANLEEGEEKLCKIVIILDEFGDLMLQARKEIESSIIKLTQKARACGIHLILATQRPSVDCITGLIKSNLPTRIGFKVNSFKDSQTIFDIGGAEKLLGKGDMYFKSADKSNLERIQGCFIKEEIQDIVDYVSEKNEHYFDPDVEEFINKTDEDTVQGSTSGVKGGSSDTKIDDTYVRALRFCIDNKAASVTSIQRHVGVNYVKACKIIDWMTEMSYITPAQGSKPRNVIMTLDEFVQTYGDVDG